MSSAVAELIVRLKDEASHQADAVARALGGIAAQERAIGTQSAEMRKLVENLNKAKAAAAKADLFAGARKGLAETRSAFNQAQEAVRKAAANMAAATEENASKMQSALRRAQREVRQTSRAYEMAQERAKSAYRDIGGNVKGAIDLQNKLTNEINQTTSAIERQAAAERQMAAAVAKQNREATIRDGRRRFRREAGGIGLMIGSLAAGEAASEIARGTLRTYKEFDDTRRKQKAILGLTPEQQAPFIEQAIHMGATTRFNDLQVLEAQTDLAQRGVKPEFIRPFVQQAAGYAGAMGTDLPDAVKTLEGIIFGTGKHIEDAGEAMATMKRVVDQSVKLAKIGGLDDEDIKQFFKYGAMPGSSAGLSDETLGAIAALMRRANIRGDEAGVATRTMAAKLVSPTNKGLAALDSMGIDYGSFAKAGPISADNMARAFERSFGKKLTADGMKALQAAISDDDVAGNQEAFITAFSDAAAGSFEKTKSGKVRASDANKVAKFASTFWKNSVDSIDSEGLLKAIMDANPTLAQLNAFFTDKQGARIGAAMKDPAMFRDYRDKLVHAPDDFANTIANERQGGFSGAVDRFEGAIKNLETAVGRSWDANGQGGLLTKATDLLGKSIQHIAELDPNILAFGSAIGIAAGKVSEFLAAWGLVNTLLEFKASTALTASAASLEGAAVALTRAAGAQAGEAALDGAGGLGAPGKGKRGFWGGVLGLVPQVALYEAGKWAIDSAFSALPKPQKQLPADYDMSTFGAAKRLWGDITAAPKPMTPALSNAHTISKIDYVDMERANRAAADYRQNPEAARGRAMMELHSLDQTKAKADEAGAALDGLNTTVSPKVDTGGLDAALAKIRAIAAGIDDVNAKSRISATVSSIGQQLRGIHSDAGIAGAGGGGGSGF